MWSTTSRHRRGREPRPDVAGAPAPVTGGGLLALPISTPRLVLRDFDAGDLEAVLAYASDPDVTRLMFYGPRDRDDTLAFLRRMAESQASRPRMRWELAAIERASGGLIGSCDLTLENEREADLGYIFAQPSWGRGYATEAARAMVRAGFEQLELERIFAMCDVSHGASRRVLEKAGLRSKGIVHGVRQAKGRSWDMWLYELWRNEWLRARRS